MMTRWTRAFGITLAVVGLLLASSAVALPPGKVHEYEMLLAVGFEDADEEIADEEARRLRAKRHRKITEKVAERLRYRAQVVREEAVARPMRGGRVKVSMRTRRERGWVEAIMLGQGAMRVAPILDQYMLWNEVADSIPEGAALKRHPQYGHYLWSEDAEALKRLAEAFIFPDKKFYVVTDSDGGWRLMWAGAPVLTEREVNEAAPRASVAGVAFIEAKLTKEGAQRWEQVEELTPMMFTVDGEVIDTFRAGEATQRTLTLQCGREWAADAQAQRECVEIVSARVSAPIPMRLSVIRRAE